MDSPAGYDESHALAPPDPYGRLEDFEQAAYRQARSRGHPGLRPEHGLLVILEGAENDPAKRAMREVGMTVDEVTAVVDSVMTSRPQLGSPGYVWPTPLWARALGRTEGFVHTIGRGDFRPAHFLLAVLWDTTRCGFPAWDDLRRTAMIDELELLGEPLPASKPTHRAELSMWQQVAFARDRLDGVLEQLRQRQMPGDGGPLYGFNFDGERAWIAAEDGIDLQAMVEFAQAGESKDSE